MSVEFINDPGEANIRTALSKINLRAHAFKDNRFQHNAFTAKDIDAYFFFKTDFSESDITKYRFADCRFHKASFRGTDLSQVSFYHCIFKETDFSNARLNSARFVHCIIEQSVLDRSDLHHILLERCFFHSIRLDHVINIGGCRALAGLFLKCHAGSSSEKHKIADTLSDSAIGHDAVEKMIKALPLIFRKWMEQVCDAHPEAGLVESFRKIGLYAESKHSTESHYKTIFDTVLPPNFAILRCKNASYYAVTNNKNLITAKNIRAKLIDYHKENKYPVDGAEIVSVIAEKGPTPALEDIESIHWPFPPLNIIEESAWNLNAQVNLEGMIKDEQLVSDLICGYLKDYLYGVKSVIDIACSHGIVLKQLHDLNPNLLLMGRDIASEMVVKSAEKVPWADIRIGNALDLGSIKSDFVILRATGQAVASPSEAEKMIQEGLRILNPGGKLIVCSLTPPVFDPAHLEKWGKVLVRTKIVGESISAFYVLQQK